MRISARLLAACAFSAVAAFTVSSCAEAQQEQAPPTDAELAAEELIALHGIEGFQLKDVADRVGIKPPSVFAHFKGRDAIARAVSERLIKSMLELMSIRNSEPPDATLRRWVNDIMRHLHANPAHVRIMLRDMAQSSSIEKKDHEATQDLLAECERRIEHIIDRGVESGDFRKVRAGSVMSHFVGAALANLSWHGYDDEGHPVLESPFEEICEETCELLIAYVSISDA